MTGKEILNLTMNPDNNDAGAHTIREYLQELLLSLWDRREGFDGKRPFGNSSWEMDLMIPLAEAGLIEASYYRENGEILYLDTYDSESGNKLIQKAIEAL